MLILLQVKGDELHFLQPQHNFRVSLHARTFRAPADYFDLCAMELLYIHDSPEFSDVEKVSNTLTSIEANAQLIEAVRNGECCC